MRRAALVVALSLTAIVVLAGCGGHAAEGTVAGTLEGPEAPEPGVMVMVSGHVVAVDSAGMKFTAVVGANGRFSLSLSPGTYHLTGYSPMGVDQRGGNAVLRDQRRPRNGRQTYAGDQGHLSLRIRAVDFSVLTMQLPALAGLRSGDGPLSLRRHPSTVQGASRFLPEVAFGHPGPRSLYAASGQKPRARAAVGRSGALTDSERKSRGLSVSLPNLIGLWLLACGQGNSEIAAALGVSVHTIERHVANVFAKLSVTNRAGATAWAYRRGLVS